MLIKINKTQISKLSDEFLDNVNQFDVYIKKLYNLLENIESSWQGADEAKLINVMKDNYLVAMHEFKEVLNNYGTYLKKIPNVYGTLDDNYANKKLGVDENA